MLPSEEGLFVFWEALSFNNYKIPNKIEKMCDEK